MRSCSRAGTRRWAAILGHCFTTPWLWHLGLRKSFLVYGVTLTAQ